MPHFTHRTPCDRVTRPTPRRSILHRVLSVSLPLSLRVWVSGWVDLEFHATPRSNGRCAAIFLSLSKIEGTGMI